MTDAPAIVLQGLTREFAGQRAVDGLTLTVPLGSFYGFLGANGAGKSTTINILTGLLSPTAGQARVLGHDVVAEPLAVKRRIGVVPDGLALFERLSGAEQLQFVGRMYGLGPVQTAQRAEELLAALELTADAGKLIGGYSHGMRKKLALCCALIHNPPLLFLDEPFEGVDAVAAKGIRDLLARMVAKGHTTVFLTSHVLEIVERLCTHVGIIDRGRLVADGLIGDLRRGPDGEERSLESLFLTLVGGGRDPGAGLSWLGLIAGPVDLLFLLRLKLRLLTRSFARQRSGLRTVLGSGFLILAMTPVWLGFTMAAYRTVMAGGRAAAGAIFLAVHLGWLVSGFLFAAFAEGFDWRVMLRFPVAPRAVFWINVLLAPVDLVALFLFPPLVATVAALGRGQGAGAAVAGGVAGVLVLLITGATLQILFAAFGRFLRREWSRAVAGMLFGLLFALPSVIFNQSLRRGHNLGSALPSRSLMGVFSATATAAAGWLPPTAGLVWLTSGRQWWWMALGALEATAWLLLLVRVGTRFAHQAALQGDSGAGSPAAAPGASKRPVAGRRWTPSSQLGVGMQRELRYWTRTPQVVMGLLLSPLLVSFVARQALLMGPLGSFMIAFFCLTSALNLSANQFGLDREGVRLLFLLPVDSRRLILSKNLACAVIVSGEMVLVQAVTALTHVAMTPSQRLLAVLYTAAVLPATLMAGNRMSANHPWRMTFRVGGTPPGAMTSAFSQMGILVVMVLVLGVPSLLVRVTEVSNGRLWECLWAGLIGGAMWFWWAVSLSHAARRLEQRRESVLATLARPHEAG